MFKKLKLRLQHIGERKIWIFYLIVGIVTIVSFYLAVKDSTEWHMWKILPLTLVIFWIISFYLYYILKDRV